MSSIDTLPRRKGNSIRRTQAKKRENQKGEKRKGCALFASEKKTKGRRESASTSAKGEAEAFTEASRGPGQSKKGKGKSGISLARSVRR